MWPPEDREELPPPFYNSKECWDVDKMNKRGRPLKYLTLEEWRKWLNNDWRHAELRSRATFWFSVSILIAVIGKLVVDFFF